MTDRLRSPITPPRILEPLAAAVAATMPAGAAPRRRIGSRGLTSMFIVSLVIVASTNSTARAGHLVLNYQKSQWTGWKDPKGNNINTLGGHTSPLTFDDGTKDGRTYQISLLPFGQKGTPPDPVYEDKPANGTINYDKILTGAFGATYAFNYTGGFTGKDEFNVQSYSVFANNGGQVGADLYVVYNPDKGDPAINANLHWIQVLWNNWASGPGNTTGKVDNKVDNGGAANPYYDTNGSAGTTTIDGKQVFNFYDIPGRPSSELAEYNFKTPIQWMAEDFLVSDTGKKNGKGQEMINVYGGIEWGWQVKMQSAPEPSSLVLAATGVLFVLGLIRRRRGVPIGAGGA